MFSPILERFYERRWRGLRGAVRTYVGVMNDVDRGEGLQVAHAHHASYDTLTNGLPPQSPSRPLSQALANARRRCAANGRRPSFLDIDNFKLVNDSLGTLWATRCFAVPPRSACARACAESIGRAGATSFVLVLPACARRAFEADITAHMDKNLTQGRRSRSCSRAAHASDVQPRRERPFPQDGRRLGRTLLRNADAGDEPREGARSRNRVRCVFTADVSRAASSAGRERAARGPSSGPRSSATSSSCTNQPQVGQRGGADRGRRRPLLRWRHPPSGARFAPGAVTSDFPPRSPGAHASCRARLSRRGCSNERVPAEQGRARNEGLGLRRSPWP
jgi:GGDEF domain-containing protein